jgi:hypothetical protein
MIFKEPRSREQLCIPFFTSLPSMPRIPVLGRVTSCRWTAIYDPMSNWHASRSKHRSLLQPLHIHRRDYDEQGQLGNLYVEVED